MFIHNLAPYSTLSKDKQVCKPCHQYKDSLQPGLVFLENCPIVTTGHLVQAKTHENVSLFPSMRVQRARHWESHVTQVTTDFYFARTLLWLVKVHNVRYGPTWTREEVYIFKEYSYATDSEIKFRIFCLYSLWKVTGPGATVNSIIAALRSDQNSASFKPKGITSLVRTLLFKGRSFFQGVHANPRLHFLPH